ncbi:hypothetical protein BGZ58_007728 [Dissophora ornata]|nr:hypothetical protein BGZ58_007728 [Dissophora ornata]
MSPPIYSKEDDHPHYHSPPQRSSFLGYTNSSTSSPAAQLSTSYQSSSPTASNTHPKLPVRLPLGDHRLYKYKYLTSPMSSSSQPPSAVSRQDQAPLNARSPSNPVTAAALTKAFIAETSTQSRHNYWREYRSTSDHGLGEGHDHEDSTSPSPLPSPAPSMVALPSDFQVVCRHSHNEEHQHTQPQQQQRPPRSSMESRFDLFSPSPTSSMDLAPDSRRLPPLFSSMSPPHQTTRLPSITAATGYPVHVANSLSRSSNISSTSSHASAGMFFDPARNNSAVSPHLSTQAWPSKHHHPRIPVRSPEREGQDLMMTSSVDAASSPFLNMDYYDIYQQNPRFLRPEGGRQDERRHSEQYYYEGASATSIGEHVQRNHYTEAYPHNVSKSKGKSKARVSATTANKNRSRSPNASGPIRRHSVSLASTGTYRVLRHEDRRQEVDRNSHDIVRGLGIQSASKSSSSSSRPHSMSISNLLTDDFSVDRSSNGSPYLFHSSSSSAGGSTYGGSNIGIKREKASNTDDNGEPVKLKRMSKKRATELGLLDEDGNIMKKRKRTKKIQDPDHVSPSGFRHGGERVVQEPDVLVTLEPDVGPVSMLDNGSQPAVVWKGHPLSVVGKPGYEQLHPYEVHVASTLRLSPAQYLSCKRTLILASREYFATPDGKQFRKSDAQKLCRIDVNKTSRLWEVFAKVGWLEGISEKDI